MVFEGRAPREKQNNEQSTYAPMLDKETARINWTKTNIEIYNLVRGTNPWPAAWSVLQGEMVKIHTVKLIENELNAPPGAIMGTNRNDGIVVACRKGGIGILELQFPGKPRMSTQDYLRGHKLGANDSFV
ncbi:Methionyl-tRNA formyltransferase [bioreactor metagenome]|uniref:Methionyl-tRNA formyltransferase n=1 Tax=bioreactor metagenome TaxID=1076179 RepID=A0A645JXM4_9ZZZZ